MSYASRSSCATTATACRCHHRDACFHISRCCQGCHAQVPACAKRCYHALRAREARREARRNIAANHPKFRLTPCQTCFCATYTEQCVNGAPCRRCLSATRQPTRDACRRAMMLLLLTIPDEFAGAQCLRPPSLQRRTPLSLMALPILLFINNFHYNIIFMLSLTSVPADTRHRMPTDVRCPLSPRSPCPRCRDLSPAPDIFRNDVFAPC